MATAEGVMYEGLIRQPCLVKQEWEAPKNEDGEELRSPYGYYQVESGARYLYVDETTNEETQFDFEHSHWHVEYRAPETAAELEVQIQGKEENLETISVT